MIRILPYLLILWLFAACTPLLAQQPANFIYGGFGMNQYRGDLQTDYPSYTPSISLGLKFNKSRRFNGNFELSYGRISGENSYYSYEGDEMATPNRFFSSYLFSLQYNLHFNILKKERYTLYLSQGFGLLRYNPIDDLERPLQDRYETRAPNETYSNSSVMLPSQLGFIYLLPNQWGLGLQAGYLNPITDYLDNIGNWGNKSGNDNVLRFRFAVYVPVNLKATEAP